MERRRGLTLKQQDNILRDWDRMYSCLAIIHTWAKVDGELRVEDVMELIDDRLGQLRYMSEERIR